MKEVPLSKGYVAIVDDIDYERVSQYKWHATEARNRDGKLRTVYAQSNLRMNGKRRMQKMHRFILRVDSPSINCDHINHNGLDNRRSNLRVCSVTQNMGNRLMNANNKSGFKGVMWHKQHAKWAAKIGINGVRKHLGYFDNPEDAARAYAAAAVVRFGDFANVEGR